MSKLNRYLVIALVLQLLILGLSRISSRGPSVTKPQKLFDKLDVEKVTWLRIEQAKKGEDKGSPDVAELAKQDGRWVLVSGGGYPAKKDKITELLGKISGLTAGPPVTTKAEHYRKLEVADDDYQRKVAFKTEDGKMHRFLLGSSPGIKNVHLRMEGEKAVYLASELTAWDASALASDWVESDYFKLDKDRIVALTLKNSNGEIKLAKADGKWTAEGMPEGATLKQTEIDSLLGSASSVALKAPVGREQKPEEGLAPDRASALLTVVVEEKKDAKKKEPAASQPVEVPPARVTHTLTVGAKAKDDYYVKSGGSEFVVKAASWAVDPLIKKKPADLWETKEQKEEKEKKDKEAKPGQPGLPQ